MITPLPTRNESTILNTSNEAVNELLMYSRLGIPVPEAAILTAPTSTTDTDTGNLVKFWCYFCAEEVQRDQVVDDAVVKYSLLWEHFQRFVY